jgi:hypothetical protein
MLEVFDVPQGSPQWLKCRLGLPTASNFATVMRAKGKGDNGTSAERTTLLNKLAGEIITGEPMESYTNANMERGIEWEDEARNLYAFVHDAELTRVGFLRNGQKGASPDALLGKGGGLEIKTALPHIQIARLRKGTLPSEHVAQVQGNIWVAEREFWDFVSYSRKLPLLVIRVYRDNEYIRHMSECIDIFNQELAQTVDYIRTYGAAA